MLRKASAESVSYTHLDVYKRQAHYRQSAGIAQIGRLAALVDQDVGHRRACVGRLDDAAYVDAFSRQPVEDDFAKEVLANLAQGGHAQPQMGGHDGDVARATRSQRQIRDALQILSLIHI